MLVDPRITPLKKPGISSAWMGSPWLSLAISADFSLVGGLEHVLFSISFMGCHPSHWRTHIFQDGYCTTNQYYNIIIYIMSVLLPFTCHRNCRNISTSHAYPPLQVPAGGWTQILLYMGWCEVSRGPGAQRNPRNHPICDNKGQSISNIVVLWYSIWILWFIVL